MGVDDQSHADICDFLYGSDQITELVAFQRSDGAKASVSKYSKQVVYNSSFWSSLEYKGRFNATAAAASFLAKHPQMKQEYEKAAQVRTGNTLDLWEFFLTSEGGLKRKFKFVD